MDLAQSYNEIREAHASLAPQLDRGMLVVMAGKIEAINREHYTVGKYTVHLEGKPMRWSCTCPQGSDFASIEILNGYPGKVCKHIAGVAICLKAEQRFPPPKNLFHLFQRIILSGYNAPLPWNLPRQIAVLGNGTEDEYRLRLRRGMVVSGDLAEWAGEGFVMLYEAKSEYDKWVGEF